MTLPFIPAMRRTPARLTTGMTPGSTGLSHPELGQLVDEPQVVVDAEEELGHREVGRLELGGEVAAVARPDRESGGGARGGRPRRSEKPAGCARTCSTSSTACSNSPPGVEPSAGGSPPRARMLSIPCVGVVVEQLGDVGSGVADAGQVGHGREGLLAVDPRDDVAGALAGAPEGAVGDRHERRAQLGQVGDRLLEGALGLVGLGREELERQRGPGVEEVGDPGHGVDTLERRAGVRPGQPRSRGRTPEHGPEPDAGAALDARPTHRAARPARRRREGGSGSRPRCCSPTPAGHPAPAPCRPRLGRGSS